MHVPPDHRAHVAVPVERGEKFVRVLEPHLIEPAAGQGDRMVVQANHHVARGGRGQCIMQLGQRSLGQPPARRTGNAAVEQDDAPRTHVHAAAQPERLPAELPPHCGRVIMVTGQA